MLTTEWLFFSSDVAFVNMRKELTAATRELEKVRKHMQDLERDAADRERELLRLKADRMYS